MKILKSFKRVVLFIVLFFFYVSAKSQIKIQTLVPTGVVSVCSDAFEINILIINTASRVDSIKITHILPLGVNIVNVAPVKNMTAMDIQNTNKPIFYFNTIAANDTILIQLSALADCNAKNNLIADTTIADYILNATHITQKAPSISYNLEMATMNIDITSASNFNISNTFNRTINICNNGAGSVNKLVLSYTKEPEIRMDYFEIIGSNKNIFITKDVSGSFLIDSTLLKTLNGRPFLMGGKNECIIVKEHSTVISCKSGTGTYAATWGCGGENCQKADTTSNINVIAGTPNLTVSIKTPLPIETSYCTPDSIGSFDIFFSNTTKDIQGSSNLPAGNAIATNVKFIVQSTKAMATITDIFIDGVNSKNIPGIKITSTNEIAVTGRLDTIITIDFSKVTKQFSAAIKDYDGDGFFDDVWANAIDTFKVTVFYRLHFDSTLTKSPGNNFYYICKVYPAFSDQCGKDMYVNPESGVNIRYISN